MKATSIQMRAALAELNAYCTSLPKEVYRVRMTMEFAVFLTEECLMTFCDSDCYFNERYLVEFDESLPKFWSF